MKLNKEKWIFLAIVCLIWFGTTYFISKEVLNTKDIHSYNAYSLAIYSLSALGVLLTFILMYWNLKSVEEVVESERKSRQFDNCIKLGKEWSKPEIFDSYTELLKCKNKCKEPIKACEKAAKVFNFFEDVALYIQFNEVNKQVIEHQFKSIFIDAFDCCNEWIDNYVSNNYEKSAKTLKNLRKYWN